MNVIEALERRRSTRHFEPDGLLLTRESIEELIAEACLAPSEFNLQPWRFIVVRDRERKEVLRECLHRQERVRDASALVIVCGDLKGYDRAGEVVDDWIDQGIVPAGAGQDMVEGIKTFYKKSDLARAGLALRNPGFVAMALMLLATERGIASSPITGFDENAIKKVFSIPDRFVPGVIVALGLPSLRTGQPPRGKRLGPEITVFHEDMNGFKS